ncbi:MAG: PQQ-like beta-propeller repeat protein, partial [Amylibacter sp.]
GHKGLARNMVGAISGDPVIVGNTIYAANQLGRLVSINKETGERNWTVNDGTYSPVWVTADLSLWLLMNLCLNGWMLPRVLKYGP